MAYRILYALCMSHLPFTVENVISRIKYRHEKANGFTCYRSTMRNSQASMVYRYIRAEIIELKLRY